MSEKINTISLEYFRGLPRSRFDFSAKNTVICGSNGKGKSGLVDGIEFLFSGQVGRFVGTGTQGINHDDAVSHVGRGGQPKVGLSLSPSNASFSRTLGAEALQFCNRGQGPDYYGSHPSANSFILRRAQILEFISSQPSDRYKKFVQLLGISEIDSLQTSFIAVEKETLAASKAALATYAANISAFNDPATGFTPKNQEQIIGKASSLAEEVGGEKIGDALAVSRVAEALKLRRSAANREKLESYTKAIAAVELALSSTVVEDAADFASKLERLSEVSRKIVDSSKAGVIESGLAFFSANRDESVCPLCEQALPCSIDELVARLDVRSEELRELKEARRECDAAISKLKSGVSAMLSTINRDLTHVEVFQAPHVTVLREALADAEALSAALNSSSLVNPLNIPASLGSLAGARAECLGQLNKEKGALVSPDASKLEAAIGYLERIDAARAGIDEALAISLRKSEVARRAKTANAAFKKSRETAIETVFGQISTTVLSFYRKLHDWVEANETSECTSLSLTPDSRAAAGGLKLAIQFLQVADPKDPRAFLSEGHLDSLGLCIFLATVKIFNTPGTLLVLDDVLTSVDKDHRHRVGELLLDEFSDYQIVLTTHDEHWFDLLKSVTRARGAQASWKFTKVEAWSVERGPTLSVRDDSWDYIDLHLTEPDYRELGGPLRLVLEDFLKRVAVKLETKLKFKFDGKYTSGDFAAAGIQDDLRKGLAKAIRTHNASVVSEADINTAVGRVFGTGDLINFLSHDNPGRLEVTFLQARDFVSSLKLLIRESIRYGMMRG